MTSGVAAKGKLLDKQDLCRAYRVSLHTVCKWRKQGLPVAERGKRGKLFFEKKVVDAWLVAQGIQPGWRGREGGEGRGRQSRRAKKPLAEGEDEDAEGRRGASGSPGGGPDDGPGARPEPPEGELGLDAALRRIRRREWQVDREIEDQGRADPLKRQGLLRTYKEVFEQLRKAEQDAIKVQQAQGVLLNRTDVEDTVAALCAAIRGHVERFAEQQAPRIVSAVLAKGIEVGDLNEFQRILQGACRDGADEWLRVLSDALRKAPSLGSPEGLETAIL